MSPLIKIAGADYNDPATQYNTAQCPTRSERHYDPCASDGGAAKKREVTR